MIKENEINALQREDILLFEKIQKGNYEGIDMLFKKYYKNLCRFGAAYEPNSHVVEEKVADVFISLWNNRSNLNKIINPKSYIYVIVKNNLRKKNKINFTNKSFVDDPFIVQSLSPSIEDEIIAREQMEINQNIIRNILNDIPKRTLQIFELSRIDGFKYKEISELMEISPKTVENHIGMALKHISKGLASYKI